MQKTVSRTVKFAFRSVIEQHFGTSSLIMTDSSDLADLTETRWSKIKENLASLLEEIAEDPEVIRSDHPIPTLQAIKASQTCLNETFSDIRSKICERQKEISLKQEIELLEQELSQKSKLLERCRAFLDFWKDTINTVSAPLKPEEET